MARTSNPSHRLAFSVDETAAALGLSHRSVRRAIERGQLEAVRVGQRVVIPAEAIDRLLRGEARQ